MAVGVESSVGGVSKACVRSVDRGGVEDPRVVGGEINGVRKAMGFFWPYIRSMSALNISQAN